MKWNRILVVVGVPVVMAATVMASGTIVTTNATIQSGSAATQGMVTIDPCADGAPSRAIPDVGAVADLGTMTGTLPAFPGLGDGGDGVFVESSFSTWGAGTYNYTSYTVQPDATVTYTGPVIINVTGLAKIEGAVVSNAPGASIEFRCNQFAGRGTSTIVDEGIRTTGTASPITIHTADQANIGNGSPQFALLAQSGDVTVVTQDAFIITNATIEATTGGVTLQSDWMINVSGDGNDGDRIHAGGGTLLMQAFGGDLMTRADSSEYQISAGEGFDVTLEASDNVQVRGRSLVDCESGTLNIRAFGGDVTVQLADIDLRGVGAEGFLMASGGITMQTATDIDVGSGSLLLAAHGGDVLLQGDTEGSTSTLRSGSGDIEFQASDSVVMENNSRIQTSGGRVDVRAVGGDFRMTGAGQVAIDTTGPVDIRVRDEIATGGTSGYSIVGSEVGLSSDLAGINVQLQECTALSGDLEILSNGPIDLLGTFLAREDVLITSLLGDVDVSSAVVVTSDVAIETGGREGDPFSESGWIDIECHDPDGTIDCTNATVRSGNADTTSGNVSVRVFGDPAVESFLLPKSVKLKLNDRDPSRSAVTVSGFFDSGPEVPDLDRPATVTVGDHSVALGALTPDSSGKKFKYKDEQVQFQIVLSKSGSSRGKFKLKITDDFDGGIPVDGEVSISLESEDIDPGATVLLVGGKYKLGKIRGSLVEPHVHLFKAKATLKGEGEDGFLVKAGLAVDGGTPGAADDFTIGFGPTCLVTIPSEEFSVSGDKHTFKGDRDGVKQVVVDYAKGTVTVKAKGVTLGEFREGESSVDVVIGIGDDERTVSVRMVRKGGKLTY